MSTSARQAEQTTAHVAAQVAEIRGIDNLKVARYEFVIEAIDPLFLPLYKGSTFRGGFGTAFKSVSCSNRARECRDCLLRHACPYAYVFETAPQEGSEALTKFERVPHPFVLEPPSTQAQEFRPGDEISFGLVLVGRGIEFMPYFIVAFQEFGRTGIGRGRGRFRLARAYARLRVKATTRDAACGQAEEDALVFDGRTNTVYAHDSIVTWADLLAASASTSGRQMTVSFETMTRLKFAGSLSDRPEFHVLIRSLLRRISSLLYFHHETRLDMDFRDFISRAEGVRLAQHNTHWVDWERYSSRQDARMKLGGIVGTATYEFDAPELAAFFLPWLLAGEYVHVGKGATFGLGLISTTLSGREGAGPNPGANKERKMRW